MRARTYDLEGLLDLPSIRDLGARRSSFRQAFATLARAEGPSPLDGVSPQSLERGIKVAIESGFLEDLDWLSPEAVGVALYELGAALPAGAEKRDVGRRVLARLNEGNAQVFASIATRMALGTRKGLGGAAIRARVSLLFAAPMSSVDAGPLAFAFVSRRELAREWISVPSTGSLPARRLAARMLERAAIVAARRAAQGDDYASRVFATEAIAGAFSRLIADREPLVWRHAAVARGLLAGVAPAHWKATVESLHPRLSPTEWRRGAVSVVAAIATSPERAGNRARDLLGSAIATQDRGLPATMAWGLARALDAEPEAAEALLTMLLDADEGGLAEPLAAISRDVGGETARRVIDGARARIAGRISSPDATKNEAERVVARALSVELAQDRPGETTVREAVSRALEIFIERGGREVHAAAIEALKVARMTLSALEGLEPTTDAGGGAAMGAMAARTSVLLLRDFDAALLEEATLESLLMLGRRSSEEGARARGGAQVEVEVSPVDELHDRLGRWLLSHERSGPGPDASAQSMSGRRLRALLHLVDAEGAGADDEADAPRAARIRARRVEVASTLLERLVRERKTPLHRQLCATVARALDALVRDGTCEPVDVMLVVGSVLTEGSDVGTFADASMNPDVESTLVAFARFVRVATNDEAPTSSQQALLDDEPPSRLSHHDVRETDPVAVRIEAIFELAAALGDDGSGRAEALRSGLVKMARALQNVANASSRKAIVDATAAGIDAFVGAAFAYAHAESGARLRVLGAADESPASTVSVAGASRLAMLFGRIVDANEADARAGVEEALSEIGRMVAPAFSRVAREVFRRALALPLESSGEPSSNAGLHVAEELPAWLGARRTIGGFYVVRPLGGGGAASVFIAKRLEERHDSAAELFALKVPDYDGAAARSLSEKEFLDFFRAEASALLGLPPAKNLARFVTFDLAARPKPILVMELIEGPTLERFIATTVGMNEKQRPNAGRAFDILDGILAGLEMMHEHSVGHLDVKPSNVILREGQGPALVDFGLSGRHIRPGCATGPYGAPEVWGVVPDDFTGQPSPLPADVYAFAALAFEVLTGDTLFDADSEITIIGKHLAHDGDPALLERLDAHKPLKALLSQALRRDPRMRITVPKLRVGLREIGKKLENAAWPMG